MNLKKLYFIILDKHNHNHFLKEWKNIINKFMIIYYFNQKLKISLEK